jgi:hypothetical protein
VLCIAQDFESDGVTSRHAGIENPIQFEKC